MRDDEIEERRAKWGQGKNVSEMAIRTAEGERGKNVKKTAGVGIASASIRDSAKENKREEES